MVLEIRRRHHHKESIGPGTHLVDIAGEINPVYVEIDIGKIRRIMMKAPEIFYTVVSPHIPRYGIAILQKELSQSRGPASSSHYGDMSRK